MRKIGFIGLGVMGSHMALNVTAGAGLPVIGFDVSIARMKAYEEAGGVCAENADEIYSTCDVIIQMLPTHETISASVRRGLELGRPGNIIIDMSSADPGLIKELGAEAESAGMFLMDSPVSGGNPMAKAGTLSIMTGGDRDVFDRIRPILECMGYPVYTGGPGSGDTVKLINNMIGGAMLAAMAEAYALAEKAGLDPELTFEATRRGFIGGPLYENKVPKMIAEDYEPGARIAVHYKDIVNARKFASDTGMEVPVTDQVYRIMDWMVRNGYQDLDQAAMIMYYRRIKSGNVDITKK